MRMEAGRMMMIVTRTSKPFDLALGAETSNICERNFPRLLYFQFLVATIALQNNHPLALSLLKYVCAATKETKSTAVFNIQASVVLSSLSKYNHLTLR